jgi:regulator of cell morphogenesis and NO signaling
MSKNGNKTVGELALEDPGLIHVFDNLGIDYCCAGGKSLEEACAAANVPMDELLRAVDQEEILGEHDNPAARDWQREPLFGIIEHILHKHHHFVRRELVHLDALFAKTCSAHGSAYPELLSMQALFRELSQELLSHMANEEQVLFPYITELEERLSRQEALAPPHLKTLSAVRAMMQEHELAGSKLAEIRELSCNYSVPAHACAAWRSLYALLREFERDLHHHVHLENNLLFPRALEMERAALRRCTVAM